MSAGPQLRDRPLGWKLAAIVVPVGALGLLLVSAAYFGYEWATARRALREETGALASVVAANTAAAVSFSDLDNAQNTLDNLAAVPSVSLACLYGRVLEGAERLLASYPAAAMKSCPAQVPETSEGAGDAAEVVREVAVRGEAIGHLLLRRDLSGLRERITLQSLLGAGAFAAVMALLAVTLIVSLQRAIIEPVLQLARKAGQIRTSRNYNLRADKQAEDEIGALVDAFNAMLDEIQAAQRQLVESEKMASLGALVAGVAHEVNTPMGIAVTAASHLADELAQLRERHAAGSLTRAEFDRFVEHCAETVTLVQTHLARGVEIISGFKQVAVDQSADYLREFDLGAYARDVAQSLSPRFKRSPYQLEVLTPGPVPVRSQPGAISQVVSNLVMNALTHAFEGRTQGRVMLHVHSQGEEAWLDVADDGRGIPESDQPRIFEPFFTTRRGQGGSGLGLHIVYNLVTQTLRGRIDVESTPGRGTRFLVRFPRYLKDGARG
ncbi:MAG TPA: ATP-binding protein [Candidatus Binatia bacterium]|nr:ATP-binding protein [Candidatus Binatia bacterium]